MPFINTITTKEITKEKKALLTQRLGDAITVLPGKTESWLMLKFEGGAEMAFKGDSESDCAMVEVELYGGADDESMNALTGKISLILEDVLGIAPERVYVKYFATGAWGYSGENF